MCGNSWWFIFTKINSFISILKTLCELFMTYYMLEATLNGCIWELVFFFLKKTNFRWAFDVNIVRFLYFLALPWLSRKSQVKFFKVIGPKTEKIPQKYHSMNNFKEASDRVPKLLLKIDFSTGLLPKLKVISL